MNLRLLAPTAGLACAVALLGHACGDDPPARPPLALPDGGDGGCTANLDGLGGLPDGALLAVVDASFGCIAAMVADDAGSRSSLTLRPVDGGSDAGLPPDGLIGLSAVFVFPSGQPDAGKYPPSPLAAGGGASLQLRDGRGFAWIPGAGGSGSGVVELTSVSDGGPNTGGVFVLEAHGTADVSLVQTQGIRADGGLDAGVVVRLRATF